MHQLCNLDRRVHVSQSAPYLNLTTQNFMVVSSKKEKRMPYIKQEDRKELKKELYPVNAGELNYCIHILLDIYLKQKGQSYQTYNDMIGALEGAKLELYRRRVSSYEDKKILENGDIEFYQQY